jgi:uncharacterized protein (DUF1684 family)
MRFQYLFYLFFLPTCLPAQDYITTMLQERKSKDSLFRYDENSPIKAGEKEKFEGLAYYKIDSTYCLQATYLPLTKVKQVKMRTTHNGTPRLFKRAGELHFQVAGKVYKLFAYQPTGRQVFKNFLFVPFYDATNGTTTYGGGRYLDITLPKNAQKVVLDFNKAYLPYCAYNETYVCPIPPKENRLPIKIEAGEQLKE